MSPTRDRQSFTLPALLALLGALTGTVFYQQVAVPPRQLPPAGETPQPMPHMAPQPRAGAVTLLAEFLNVSTDTLGGSDDGDAKVLWRAAPDRAVNHVSALLATIPDYVDSSSDWTADQNLGAIQRAAAALGYEFDRVWLPDWQPGAEDGRSGSASRLHETEPGALLFRRLDQHSRTELLIVLVVPETPTAGIHIKSFRRAMALLAAWSCAIEAAGMGTGPGSDRSLLVLGPTFSGSALSLRDNLRSVLQGDGAKPWHAVRIVSGTATNAANRGLLTFDIGTGASGVRTSFHATVHTDDDLLEALAQYLGTLNPLWADGRGVALLSESNTTYGASFQDSRAAFGNALRMSFPLHISRLRGVAGTPRRTGPSSPGSSSGVAIDLEQRAAATDHIPSLTPEVTSAIVELTLANTLQVIRRERIGAVGIFTTDKRDYLFLSREIIRAAPNVLLFTTEADLLFVQRDYGSFIRGTVVASSYPLFSGSQWLTNPVMAGRLREQFPTMGSQGIYNAALVLLGSEPRAGNRGASGALVRRALPLIDYATLDRSAGCRANERCVPPIWISVAGRDALWPLSIDERSPRDGASAAYMVPAGVASPPATRAGPVPLVEPPPFAWLLFVLVTIAAVLHGLAYLVSVVPLEGRRRGWLAAIVRRLRPLQAWLSYLVEQEVPLARLFESAERDRERRASPREPPHGDRRQVSPPDEPGDGERLRASSLEEPIHIERRRFLLICFSVVGLIALWMWHLFTIWRTGAFPVASGWWDMLFATFILVAGVGFTLTLVDRASVFGHLLPARHRRSASRRAARPSQHVLRATITALVMAVPAIGAACALWQVHLDIASASPWRAPLLLARTLSPDSWVSQTPVVLGTAAVVYLWAFWNACQLSMRGDGYDADGGLFRLLGGESARGESAAAGTASSAPVAPGEPAVEETTPSRPADRPPERPLREPRRCEVAAILASPWRRSRAWLLAVAVAVTALYAAFTWQAGHGIDGLAFSRFAWWAAVLCVFVLAHSVSQTLHLTLLLSRTLQALGAHPIALAFKRVGENGLFDWRLSARPSRAWRLEPAVALARTVEQELPGPGTTSAGGSAISASGGPPEDLVAASHALLQRPDVAFLRSKAWKSLGAVATRAVQELESTHWPKAQATVKDTPEARREGLLALLASFVIRDLLSRVVTGLSVALVMTLLLLSSHAFYAYQGRHLFVWLDLGLLVGLAVTGIAILVHFDRDRVLSWSWSTTPGRIAWSGGLVQRLAIWIGFTVFPLVAARFPELGESIAAWLEPLSKGLP